LGWRRSALSAQGRSRGRRIASAGRELGPAGKIDRLPPRSARAHVCVCVSQVERRRRGQRDSH
jgi:hypothetical protein